MYDLLGLTENREHLNSIRFDIPMFEKFCKDESYNMLEQIEINVSAFREQELLSQYIKQMLEIINQMFLEQPKAFSAIEIYEYLEVPIIEQPRKVEQLIKEKVRKQRRTKLN